MWFLLSIAALLMQTTRRSAEKRAANNISSLALTWLQQAVAMPLIVLTLFFAKFYWPTELSAHFWTLLAIYVAASSIDAYCYFKAISIADISYVAPLLTLVTVGNIAGAYFVLGQTPSVFGVMGALLIMSGAYLSNLAKRREKVNVKGAQIALALVLILVVVRSYYASIEVSMLRLTNPTTFNFYSSLFSIPFLLLVSGIIINRRPEAYRNYWSNVKLGITKHLWPLAIIGVTYTINLLATYQAKLIGPNAGYVGAIKSASVLPLVLVGVIFFKEKVVRIQWIGLGLIVLGLAAIAFN